MKKELSRIVVFVSYIITTCGIPIYIFKDFIAACLESHTVMSFFAWTGWCMLYIVYVLFMFALFGYAVSDD